MATFHNKLVLSEFMLNQFGIKKLSLMFDNKNIKNKFVN